VSHIWLEIQLRLITDALQHLDGEAREAEARRRHQLEPVVRLQQLQELPLQVTRVLH
jgi:hypothetical protein